MAATKGELEYANLDALYDAGDYARLYALLEPEICVVTQAQLDAGESDSEEDIELCWRLARVCYALHSENAGDKTKAEGYIRYGLNVINMALRLDPNHWACYKWKAILLGALGAFVGTTEKIGYAFQIREHADKANELKPNDPATLYLIGRWCYDVASIGWISRQAAKALFATPPESTYDEALRFFQQGADALVDKQSFPELFVWLGKTLTELKRKDEARVAFETAANSRSTNAADAAAIAEARTKL
eukprot:a180301_55.p2 GENE.a180301_55~~a180301_55.p2  ORF type:complete len:256 (-),score=108.47 a180301_55:67-807(-)